MKRLSLAALLLAGCVSGGAGQPAPSTADARLAELQTSMTELLERLDVMNDRITRLENAQQDSAGAAPVSSGPAVASTAPRPTAPTLPPPARQRALVGAGIADTYREGVAHYGKSRPLEARAAFQKVFDADPAGELADNALYWIGETYYDAGQYSNAMTYYRRVAEEYGDQNKAPDALYKLALTHVQSGDLALARKALGDVITRYPYSSAAGAAKAELNRIKY